MCSSISVSPSAPFSAQGSHLLPHPTVIIPTPRRHLALIQTSVPTTQPFSQGQHLTLPQSADVIRLFPIQTLAPAKIPMAVRVVGTVTQRAIDQSRQLQLFITKPKEPSNGGGGKVFKANLQKHRYTHLAESNKPYKCLYPSCEKGFNEMESLQRHEITHLAESDESFKCMNSGCGKIFSSQPKRKEHIRRAHIDKPLTCTYRYSGSGKECGKKFSPSDRYAHLRSHAIERPF